MAKAPRDPTAGAHHDATHRSDHLSANTSTAKHHNLIHPSPPPTQASMTMAKPVTSGIVIDDEGQADDVWHRHR